MTIYEAIKSRFEKGDKTVYVSCLIHGIGVVERLSDLNGELEHDSAIFVYFQDLERSGYKYLEVYSYTGFYRNCGLNPTLAIGSFNTQLKCALAIEEQCFDKSS